MVCKKNSIIIMESCVLYETEVEIKEKLGERQTPAEAICYSINEDVCDMVSRRPDA